jgi:hypothetical protein
MTLKPIASGLIAFVGHRCDQESAPIVAYKTQSHPKLVADRERPSVDREIDGIDEVRFIGC